MLSAKQTIFCYAANARSEYNADLDPARSIRCKGRRDGAFAAFRTFDRKTAHMPNTAFAIELGLRYINALPQNYAHGQLKWF